MSPRRLAGAIAVAIAATLALTVVPAGAHTDAGGTSSADGLTTVTLDVGHGCDGKPTTGLRVQLPAGATDVDAENPTGWTSTVTASEIQWSGPGLPADQSNAFEFALRLTQTAGTVVTFPTIQLCTDGASLAWIDVPSAGDTAPPYPAPTIVVGGSNDASASLSSPTTASGPTTTARMAANTEAITDAGSKTNATGRIVFLIVVAVIVIGGAIVLINARRRKQQH